MLKQTFRDFPSTYVLMLFILTHNFTHNLLTTPFFSHITHKITYFCAYYARFCTFFVSKNSVFCYVFYDEKWCKLLIINTWARYGSRTRLTGLGSPVCTLIKYWYLATYKNKRQSTHKLLTINVFHCIYYITSRLDLWVLLRDSNHSWCNAPRLSPCRNQYGNTRYPR